MLVGMSDDPTLGYYLRDGRREPEITRKHIRDALLHGLPVALDPATWAQRPLTPRGLCWFGHVIAAGDSTAVEYVSVYGGVVRFCGRCHGYWREEAATRRFLLLGPERPPLAGSERATQ
jgi:hypothetical protein